MRDIIIPKGLQDALSREAQAERERSARITLAEVEEDISEMFVRTARNLRGRGERTQIAGYEHGLRWIQGERRPRSAPELSCGSVQRHGQRQLREIVDRTLTWFVRAFSLNLYRAMQQPTDSFDLLRIEAESFTNISIECPIQTVYLVKESFKICWTRLKEGHEYALFPVGHTLSKKLAIEVDEVFVDAVLKKVSAHDVIWRAPGYSLDERRRQIGRASCRERV